MIRAGPRAFLRAHLVFAAPLGLIVLGLAGVVFGTGPLFRLLALLPVALGVAMAIAFRQRAAFARDTSAPGLVEITEARLSYLTSRGGAMLDRDSLAGIALLIDPGGTARWQFTPQDGPPLLIPLDARGADGLVDLTASLPGVDLSTVTAALAAAKPGRYPLWPAP